MDRTNQGIHHTSVGGIAVTAINDGLFQPPFEVLAGISAEQAKAALEEHFRPGPPQSWMVNCFLLTVGGRHVMVDTGAAGVFGPGLGRMPAALAAMGVQPADISTVLITHLHGDHGAGLLAPDGSAFFPKAEIVLTPQEHAFWADKDGKLPEPLRAPAEAARSFLKPYAGRVREVADGQSAMPGVTAHLLPGHTPGHTGWIIADGADSLLIWGDVIHAPAIQYRRPEVCVMFDADQALAQETRVRVLDMAARDRLRVAGMHHEFPPFGHVAKASPNYSFIPDLWTPES